MAARYVVGRTMTLLVEPASVRRHVLANGLRVLLKPDRRASVVAIVTSVNAGYLDETDDLVGVSHVAEHMYFKGTPTHAAGEMVRRARALGGYLDAETSYDRTWYCAVVPAAGFLETLELQADAFRNAHVRAVDLASEIEVIVEESRRKRDRPQDLALESLYALLFDQNRIRRWRIGQESRLRELTHEQVLGFYRRFYVPTCTTLSVVGGFDEDAAMHAVERLYGDLSAKVPPSSPPPQESAVPGFRHRDLFGDVMRTQVVAGWRTCDAFHPDAPVLDLVAELLSGGRRARLRQAMPGIAHSAEFRAASFTPRGVGVFTLAAQVDPVTSVESLGTALHQVCRLRSTPVAPGDLDRARRVAVATLARPLERVEGVAKYLAQWETLGDWRMGQAYVDRILSAGPVEVRRVAEAYLGLDATAVLFYRPRAEESAARSAAEVERALVTAATASLVERRAVSRTAELGISELVLDNGLPIVAMRRVESPLVHIGFFSAGGQADEGPHNAGVTRLMAHAALLGTGHRSAAAIAEAGESLGGAVNVTASPDCVGWTVAAAQSDLVAGVELLADVALNPTFDKALLQSGCAHALGLLAAVRDDGQAYAMSLARQAASPRHPYGMSFAGTETSLGALNRAAVQAWHRRTILTGPSAIAVVGDVDARAVADIIAGHFRRLAPRRTSAPMGPEWPRGGVRLVESGTKSQTTTVIAWPAPHRTDDRRFSMTLLADIAGGFGGRLFSELRQKQSLCYTVHASVSTHRTAGMLSFCVATAPEKEDRAREALYREAYRFASEPVSVEELDHAKAQALGMYAIHRQSGAVLLAQLADAFMLGSLSEIVDYERHIRDVTPSSVMNVAREFIRHGEQVEVTVRADPRQAIHGPQLLGAPGDRP